MEGFHRLRTVENGPCAGPRLTAPVALGSKDPSEEEERDDHNHAGGERNDDRGRRRLAHLVEPACIELEFLIQRWLATSESSPRTHRPRSRLAWRITVPRLSVAAWRRERALGDDKARARPGGRSIGECTRAFSRAACRPARRSLDCDLRSTSVSVFRPRRPCARAWSLRGSPVPTASRSPTSATASSRASYSMSGSRTWTSCPCCGAATAAMSTLNLIDTRRFHVKQGSSCAAPSDSRQPRLPAVVTTFVTTPPKSQAA